MLTEQCEELINKVFSTSVHDNSVLQEDSVAESMNSNTRKMDKVRLENEFLELCIEI